VRDAALLLRVVAGRDAADATASRRAVPDYLDGIERGVEGLRIGLPENYYFDAVDEEVAAAAHALARALASEGARIVGVLLPDPRTVMDVSSLVMSAEGAAVHGRLARQRPEEIQPVVRARLEMGLHVSAYDYIQATRLRSRLARAFAQDVFTGVDVLVVPTTPEPAPVRAEVTAGPVSAVVPRIGRFSRLTRPFNGLGLPALAVPSGRSRLGLPLSAQIVGRPFDEAGVLRAGRTWERLVGGFSRPPAD
jgi:aspartyl-tRNA(Asn)/glutamyl-tRNA(Gln) amidotransferase subunit A